MEIRRPSSCNDGTLPASKPATMAAYKSVNVVDRKLSNKRRQSYRYVFVGLAYCVSFVAGARDCAREGFLTTASKSKVIRPSDRIVSHASL
jgi:hypothetical protein